MELLSLLHGTFSELCHKLASDLEANLNTSSAEFSLHSFRFCGFLQLRYVFILMHYNYGEVRLDGPFTALQDTYVVAGRGTFPGLGKLDSHDRMLCLILIIIIHIFDII